LEETYICERGTLNPLTLKCEISETAEIVDPVVGQPLCEEGTYDSETKKCIVEGETVLPSNQQLLDDDASKTALWAGIISFTLISLGAAGYLLTRR
jgi:hypothetical protein